MLTFFRSLGGLLGVTGSGAILAHQLHAHGIAAAASAGNGPRWTRPCARSTATPSPTSSAPAP
jgi:hypothetical protein